jgi:hypothetical protein
MRVHLAADAAPLERGAAIAPREGKISPIAAMGCERKVLSIPAGYISGDDQMQIQGKHWFLLGGVFSIAIAILHIAIIFGGAPAYRYFGAGEEMAQMAASGSVLPALATLFIAVIFAVWGLYAFSGAGLIRRLPLLPIGLVVIAGIYTLRGIGVIPQIVWMVNSPKSTPPQDMIFSLASLLVGVVYFVGIISTWKTLKENSNLTQAEN